MRQANKVVLAGRPPIAYDLLTIDVGITPAVTAVPGAMQYSTPVKPISTCAKKQKTKKTKKNPIPYSIQARVHVRANPAASQR